MQLALSKRGKSLLLVLALLGVFQAKAWAQADTYPNKPIKLIITWPVGGFADTLGRTVANQLGAILGQQVVVENRGGANGMIGADAVAKAAPDGYTLMFQSVTSHAINPTMYGKTPYSTEKDIMPLAVVASVPMLLVANPNLPAKNIAELIALAKKEPDALSYATFGNGSASHLAGALFTSQAGIKIMHIPYKGGGPAITDTLGGQVPMSFSAFGLALPHVKSGKLIALGTTGPARAKLLPDVPTIEEAGNLKGYEMSIVYAVWAPTGVPAPILNKLGKALEQVVASSAFKEKVASDGGEVMTIATPAESNIYFQKEMQRLSKIVKDGNIKAD
ncbi:tripartite tricarboxylate transporter substrate binding protein [Polynucleobacter sp. AP-Latsch-80-C2]|jgi:tripartite-type tricarboxylate transporter receptor subunit TctC|uniref:Bug family tripartite tricarboxylate transporter substrate binding protein n=1 Tax=Polynucleobacter sp. AP-Latsch-80-C2 TaxID=2576931 RepID=UPI001C0B885E|nr:tripartite tricarboxylate transporter substrate binding protein [Polynucleobacter sp. AP-Latsch-80-C2]MBU3624304.1 tripartite tricarboxylate transporter substrate binding protein [Polynucleobacter sp. AP-Latsch-80-C2]